MCSTLKTGLKIEARVASRTPKENKAYDKEQHCFKEEYVRPRGWTLHLATKLPADWEWCEWHVEAQEADFKQAVFQNRKSGNPGSCTVTVPVTGAYQIRINVRTKHGDHYMEEDQFQFNDYLFVALGDSYFCGEGTPDEPGKPADFTGDIACNLATFSKFLEKKADLEVPMEKDPVWQEKEVHRSSISGIANAVRRLEDEEKGKVITFLNFARSGASIPDGFLGPREEDDWTTIGQIEEAKQTIHDRSIDALFISTGGNDIQFSDRLIDLLRDDLPIVGDGGLLGDDALNRRREREEAKKMLAKLPDKLDKLAQGVKELNPRQVFIMSYPIAQFDVFNEEGEVETRSGCGIFQGPGMDIDEKDAALIKKTGRELNEVIREAAQRHGWIYIEDIVDGFSGHGRCSDDSYFYSAEESCYNQGDFRGTLHPNEKGYEVYADCISQAVKEELFSG